MKQKVLLTGNRGFIGSNMEKALLKEDVELYVLDLKSGQDILYTELPKCDIIYHMAAKASIPESFNNPEISEINNVVGSLRIFQHAKKCGAKVIFSSSSSIYDPVSPYAIQKRQCEEYMRVLGVKGIALRYFNVFGENQEIANGGESLVLAKFLGQKQRNEPLTIVGDGKQRRDFIYVGDVVRANLMASKLEEFGIYDVGTGENISIQELADIISPIQTYLPPRIEPFENKANPNKFLPNWKPETTLKKWVEENL